MTPDARPILVEGDLYYPNATYIRLPAFPTHPLSMDLAVTLDNTSISDLESHWNSLASLAMRWLSPVKALVYSPAANA
jgi:hypothetical protein